MSRMLDTLSSSGPHSLTVKRTFLIYKEIYMVVVWRDPRLMTVKRLWPYTINELYKYTLRYIIRIYIMYIWRSG